MTLKKAIEVLNTYQSWRIGEEDVDMQKPSVVTEAINTLKDYHIVEANEMVKRGTLKKRMDKDAWFVVFQSNAYNENDMAYDLIKSQEIDIDMYDVYKDGDEVTFEVINKKWAKITPFLYPFETTSSQKEISDDQAIKLLQDINKQPMRFHCVPKEISDEEIKQKAYSLSYKDLIISIKCFIKGCEWYRDQLKQKS